VNDGVAGDERLEGGDAEFDGLLDNEVHVLPLGDSLGQGDGRQDRRDRLRRTELEGDAVTGDGEDFRRGTSAETVEDSDGGTGLQSEDLGEVAGFIAGEGGWLGLPGC
jgi:hypothetical protein